MEDELTLLYVSLALWDEWLEKHELKSSEAFVDSILINFIIIMLKNAIAPGTDRSNCLWKLLCTENADTSKITDLYDQIVKSDERKQEFFENDLKIVHRINEFQAAYFIISTFSQLSKYRFVFLGPENFLNGKFVCYFIQESQTKSSDSFELASLIKQNSCIQTALKQMGEDLGEIKNGIKRPQQTAQLDELSDLIGSFKINTMPVEQN